MQNIYSINVYEVAQPAGAVEYANCFTVER